MFKCFLRLPRALPPKLRYATKSLQYTPHNSSGYETSVIHLLSAWPRVELSRSLRQEYEMSSKNLQFCSDFLLHIYFLDATGLPVLRWICYPRSEPYSRCISSGLSFSFSSFSREKSSIAVCKASFHPSLPMPHLPLLNLDYSRYYFYRHRLIGA